MELSPKMMPKTNVEDLFHAFTRHLQCRWKYLEYFMGQESTKFEHWFQCEFLYSSKEYDPSVDIVREWHSGKFDFQVGGSDFVEMKAYKYMNAREKEVAGIWKPTEVDILADINNLREFGGSSSKWELVIFFPISKDDWEKWSKAHEKNVEHPDAGNGRLQEIVVGKKRCTLALYKVLP
jgi:hypothetical protein